MGSINANFANDSVFHSIGNFQALHAARGNTHNITGKRYYVHVNFSRRTKNPLYALYDTGASVTAISMDAMRRARKEGAMGQQIHDHGLSLTNASGRPMDIHGVFWVDLYISGKRLREPVVVLKSLAGDAIIGQNIIEAHGLMFNPVRREFSFPDGKTKATAWANAELVSIQSHTVQPQEGVLVKAILRDTLTGKKLPPAQDFVAVVAGASIAGVTDNNGITSVYVPNGTPAALELHRNDRIGIAEPADNFDMDVAPADDAAISAITADAVRDRNKSEKAAKPVVTPTVHKLINAAIKRSGIPKKMQDKYRAVLELFADVISETPDDIGHSQTVVHDIKLRTQEPVYTKQYSLPDAELSVVKQHIKDWLATGVIERSNSKFNSAIFCVRKKEGQGLRVVLDYRKLNANTLPDRYSIKTAEQLIMEVGKAGGKVFSTIDLRSGFWQMDLAKEAHPLTAFTILGEGQFQWCRGAMGLTGCPSSFSRLIEIAMRGLDNVVTYIDDI
jgi:hypothetical protein